MAGIAERNTNRIELEKKKKKQGGLLFIIILLAAAVSIGIFSVYSYVNKHFNSYTVIKTTPREDSNTVQYMAYGEDRILKYSRDGAAGLNSSGEILWNGSYDMKNPLAESCENYIVIADIGGKSAYVYNGSDSGVQVETLLPIVQACVANQGVVALVLEDKDSNIIQIYDPYNTSDSLKVDLPTNVKEDGYPVDVALSNDGQKLVTSYLYINNGVMENRVNFYNFNDYGQNSGDRIVGARNFKQDLIPKLEFINNTTVCAYGENSFTLYSMKQVPKDVKEKITLDDKIKSTFSNESYIGFVLENSKGDYKYQVVVYNTSGDKILNKGMDYEYDQVFISDKEIVFYSGMECNIMRINGTWRFHYTFDRDILYVMPVNNYNKYVLIDDTNMEEIKLTEEK